MELAPNHHADHPGFSGVTGTLFSLLFSVGRGADADRAVQLTGTAAGDTVVDVGCGPGTAARRAARAGATVVGVDPSAEMLRTARLLGRAVRWAEGTAESLPVEDGWATVVWSLSTVHHWRDLDAGLAEVRRVLQPGGRFLALERHRTGHGWLSPQASTFAERCRAAGFADATVLEPTPRRLAVLAHR